MPLYSDQSRDDLRRMYVTAWRKRRAGIPMEPLEAQIATVIEDHPEYQALLEQPDNVVNRDFSPEAGAPNPFLHMGLHLAIRDQVATDRPPGIRAAFHKLAGRHSPHDAEHTMAEMLGQALWQAQRSGQPPNERAYLEQILASTG